MYNDCVKVSVEGHLKITEKETGKILLDDHNAIHPENQSIAITRALAKKGGYISQMVFGNGGVKINGNNEFLFANPNVSGRTATLYNETYFKYIDENTTDPVNNYIQLSHGNGNIYSDIMMRCTLEPDEPEGQNVLNDEENITYEEYVFSEIGIRTSDGDLITHICHYPITKTNNISIIVDYLLRYKIG